MSGVKQTVPLLIATLFLGTSVAAIAGSQSALDPYAYINPPKGSHLKGLDSVKPESETGQTYVTTPGDDESKSLTNKSLAHVEKATKHSKGLFGSKGDAGKKEVAAAKNEASPKSNSAKKLANGLSDKTKGISGDIADKTKGIGGGIADKTKGISGGIADKTKSLGSGIASATKASSGYLVKGAKAIGSGIKSTGEKVKDGTEKVGSKVALLPKKNGNTSAIRAAKSNAKANLGEPQDTAQVPFEQTKSSAVAAASKPDRMKNKHGMIGSTISKLPFFGHKKDKTAIASPASGLPQ